MKITLVMTQSHESPGGAGRFLPIAAALKRHGHEVCIIALHHDFEQLDQTEMKVQGVPIRYVGQMHVLKRDNQKIYFGPWRLLWVTLIGTIRLTWATLRSGADLVQVCKPQPMNTVAAYLSKLLRRTKTIVDCDDYEAANNRFSAAWQKSLVTFFEDSVVRYADHILAGNRFISDRYLALGYPNAQLSTLVNGVDMETFGVLAQPDIDQQLAQIRATLPFSATDRFVLYVGSISFTSHAVDLLIDGFASLKNETSFANVRLLIVGGGENLPDCRHQAHALGLSDSVYFTGKVSHSRVPYYYRLGQLSVDPRRDTEAVRSSIPLKIFESIAAGTPVLASQIDSYAPLLGQGVYLVESDSAEAIGEGLKTLLSSNSYLDEMHTATHQMRATLSWTYKMDELRIVYDRLSGEVA